MNKEDIYVGLKYGENPTYTVIREPYYSVILKEMVVTVTDGKIKNSVPIRFLLNESFNEIKPNIKWYKKGKFIKENDSE